MHCLTHAEEAIYRNSISCLPSCVVDWPFHAQLCFFERCLEKRRTRLACAFVDLTQTWFVCEESLEIAAKRQSTRAFLKLLGLTSPAFLASMDDVVVVAVLERGTWTMLEKLQKKAAQPRVTTVRKELFSRLDCRSVSTLAWMCFDALRDSWQRRT